MKQLDSLIPLKGATEKTLRQLESLLRKASGAQNLVSFDDIPYLWERHILDSLAPLTCADDLNLSTPGLWIDIGSGAGLPLLPLAVALPHWKFIGIEPRKLRAQHLNTAMHELALTNVSILCAKSESVENFPHLHGKAQIATTRAVGKIPEDGKRARPFLSSPGWFLTYKHQETTPGIDGYHPLSYVPYQLPSEGETRNLVLAPTHSTQVKS